MKKNKLFCIWQKEKNPKECLISLSRCWYNYTEIQYGPLDPMESKHDLYVSHTESPYPNEGACPYFRLRGNIAEKIEKFESQEFCRKFL